jgi:hypothetical protein
VDIIHATNTSRMPVKPVTGDGHRKSNNAYRVGDWMTSNGILEHTKALQKETATHKELQSAAVKAFRELLENDVGLHFLASRMIHEESRRDFRFRL